MSNDVQLHSDAPTASSEDEVEVCLDMSRVYFYTRELGQGLTVSYTALVQAIEKELNKRANVWIFTTLDPQRQSQATFVTGVRNALRAKLISATPDQAVVSASQKDSSIYSLTNFSTEIVHTVGRLHASKKDCVVVSDCYNLYTTLADLARRGGAKVSLAYFMEGLDRRWLGHIVKRTLGHKFIDLSKHRDRILKTSLAHDEPTSGVWNLEDLKAI